MVTMQGVIILRISDMKRFFSLGEFLNKREEFCSLFRDEERRYSQSGCKAQALLFVDDTQQLALMQLVARWLARPETEITTASIDDQWLRVRTADDTLQFAVGRLAPYIKEARTRLTSKSIMGLTLLYTMLGANNEGDSMPILYELPSATRQLKQFNECWNDTDIEYSNDITFPL